VDKDRVFNKLFLGGTFGAFGNIAGNFGKNIKVGDVDLQTVAEVGRNKFSYCNWTSYCK